MNKAQLIGRVTKDIELRQTQSGLSVTKFTIAVNRRKKDDGADFINCTAWSKTAEIMEKYVHKGDRIGIVGRIQTGSYEKDGRKVYTTEVVVEELEFLEKKEQSETTEPKTDADGFVTPDDDFEFPF